MPRRKRKRSNAKRLRKAVSRQIRRLERNTQLIKSKIYPTSLQKTIMRNKRSLISKTIKASTPSKNRFKYDPYIVRDHAKIEKPCRERKRIADQHRRRVFFRSKSKGGSTVRPEHERRHEKCR